MTNKNCVLETCRPARSCGIGSVPAVAHVAAHRDVACTVGAPVLVADLVRTTARQHGIRYQPLPVDVFAGAVLRLSDAEVTLDTIEQLLLALARKGILTEQQRSALYATSLHQVEPKRDV